MALALGAAASAAMAQSPLTFKFGYGLKEDSNQGRAARVFAERVSQLSGGRLKMEPVGAAKLGSDDAMQKAVSAGTQEMMVGSTATLVSVVKEMALWDAPFLFNGVDEADFLLDGAIGQQIMGKLPDKGFVGLVYWENGFRNLTNSKRPINSLGDLSGLKLRVMQNDTFIKAFRTLGADARPMAFAELDAALRSGAMDGQENPFNTILSSKFYESQKYLSITNHVYSPWIVLASKKWWDKLPKADQEIIQQAATQARDFERRDTREEADRALKNLVEKGMQVNVPTFGELSRMRNRMDHIYARDIGEKVGLPLLLQVQNELIGYRDRKRK
ncbi:TRAP transporter substrate-binding protein [Ottowia testudinis]|uniref:TRAP transporter substrate-binding protein n=1 Tax=Ottowia testudinis TaxID=2816950 RepID=A0A975CE21_9BURK|nr:TRAP transporter substrate-binding protein [Ottowia testudinis]QTD44690.1 TRAP transporter substrate-binding protein [Ottowia testudinis]